MHVQSKRGRVAGYVESFGRNRSEGAEDAERKAECGLTVEATTPGETLGSREVQGVGADGAHLRRFSYRMIELSTCTTSMVVTDGT